MDLLLSGIMRNQCSKTAKNTLFAKTSNFQAKNLKMPAF